MTIPSFVTTIGDDAFFGNPALKTVEFLGAAPTTFGALGTGLSLGDGAAGLTVVYNWAFDAAQTAGGFTTPAWQGYDTVMQATVAFAMGDFGTAPATQTVAVGEAAAKPADPTSPGVRFTGWYTDANLTITADFTEAVTSNITLYAGWTSALAATGTDITPLGAVVPALLVALGVGLALLSRHRNARGA